MSTKEYNTVVLFTFDEPTLSFNAKYPEKLSIRGVTQNEFDNTMQQCEFIHQGALKPVKKNKIKHGILIGVGCLIMLIGFALLAMIGVAYQEKRQVVALLVMFGVAEAIGLLLLIIGLVVLFKSKRVITESSHSQIQKFLENENEKYASRGVEFHIKDEIIEKIELAQLTKGKAIEITHPKIEVLFNISQKEENEFERKRLLTTGKRHDAITINLDEDEEMSPVVIQNTKYSTLNSLYSLLFIQRIFHKLCLIFASC